LGEAHALGRHSVEVGGFDLLLAVTAEIAVAEIVGKDEDDVRLELWAQLFEWVDGLISGWKREGRKNEQNYLRREPLLNFPKPHTVVYLTSKAVRRPILKTTKLYANRTGNLCPGCVGEWLRTASRGDGG
jgi:hypothetical protein